MVPRTALIELGKLIAGTMAGGPLPDGLGNLGDVLAATPETVLDLIDLAVAESRRKRGDAAVVEAFGLMAGQALEVLRFRVESHHDAAIAAVAAARARLKSLAEDGKLDPSVLSLLLQQFVRAKLDLGEELQAVSMALAERAASRASADPLDIGGALAEMARQCDGDVFALQAELAERTAAFPETHRAGIVAALLGADVTALREAAIGWLLDAGPATRNDTAGLLQQAAAGGGLSATMLRRLVMMRNWLPEGERPRLDTIVRTAREKGETIAPLPPAAPRQVLASTIDGSGAQSLFVTVKDGRKQAAAAVLIKFGIGVRDAWVRAGLSKAEVEAFRFQIDSQVQCFDSGIGHVRLALGQALALAEASGVLPPFGLVDVVERTGLGAVAPEPVPVEALVARLLSDIPAARRAPDAVDRVLRESAAWDQAFPFVDSWFEHDGAVDALLRAKRLSAKRQTALVLEQYLPARRRWWAELVAWTSFTLAQDKATGDAWMALALVAQALLDERPLGEIPLMSIIAGQTVAAWRAEQG